jgi:hypothetical protein
VRVIRRARLGAHTEWRYLLTGEGRAALNEED